MQMLNAVGGAMAKNFISSNVAQYQPRMSGVWNTFKIYFAVSGSLNTLQFDLVNVLVFFLFSLMWLFSYTLREPLLSTTS